jgi:hypothetical protein
MIKAAVAVGSSVLSGIRTEIALIKILIITIAMKLQYID